MGGISRRKTYAAFIAFFILFSSCFVSTTLSRSVFSVTIIVDDNGSADYSSIEQALLAAQNGDTIFIRSGVYEEQNLIIDKTVFLIGENAATTIIQGDGTSTILSVEANEVIISNLTVSGGGGGFIVANLDVSANDCIISDNIIVDSEDVGIALHQSFRNNIINNVISNCPFAAIRCYNQSESNTIKNNRITDCINGILLGRSSNQNIQYNRVSECSKGIYIEEANNNYIAHNQLFNNEQGMFVTYAKGNLITENNFIDNTEHAKFTTWLSPTGLQLSDWDANYWDDAIDFLPKWIPGILFIRTFNPIGYFFPWGSIDWHPAEEPFDIAGLQ